MLGLALNEPREEEQIALHQSKHFEGARDLAACEHVGAEEDGVGQVGLEAEHIGGDCRGPVG